MAFFSIIFIVPLLIALGCFFFSKQICPRELGIIIGVQLLVAGISATICYFANTYDTEVWNGVVTKKKKEWTSCEHSYPCNCRQECSGSGNSRSCSTKCDTCYRHFNDWDWAVYTSNNERLEINRVDEQGSHEPKRWTAVKIGEPTARTHSYENYIKASPDSLFRHQGLKEKYITKLPQYPDNIYDYYKLDRFITVGFNSAEYNKWNNDLAKLNAKLGAKKEVNIIVIIAKNLPEEYYYALEDFWIGGKKNDIVLVIGIGFNNEPNWVNVMTWEANQIFKIKLRDAVLDKKSIDRDFILSALEDNIVKFHKRKPMAEFEYLKSSITPTPTEWVICLIIGFIISIGMSIYFHKHNMFGYYG